MKLLQFRIRAHKVLADTHWVPVKDGINILTSDDSQAVQAMFELLQTIQPLSSMHLQPLAANMRRRVSQHGYNKRVIAKKKTAAFAIFAADNSLVRDIAPLDEALYELDRIEVGRRIDHSRWMNFVELASSTRWSEIDQQLRQLLHDVTQQCPPKLLQPLKEMVALRKGTDRLHRGLDQTLVYQLTALLPALNPDQKGMYEIILHAAQRSQRFTLAKETIYSQIPFFIHLVDQGNQNTPLQITLLTDLLNNKPIHQYPPVEEELNNMIQNLFFPLPSPARVAIKGQTISLTGDPTSVPHLVQSLAALHHVMFGTLPIFLVDCLNSSPQTIKEILSTLQLMRGSRSILAVSNSLFPPVQQQLQSTSTMSDHTWEK